MVVGSRRRHLIKVAVPRYSWKNSLGKPQFSQQLTKLPRVMRRPTTILPRGAIVPISAAPSLRRQRTRRTPNSRPICCAIPFRKQAFFPTIPASFPGTIRFRGGSFIDLVEESSSMYKMKTHKATKKRFRITASGKVKHRSSGTSHLQVRLSSKRRRNLRGTTVLDKTMQKQIHKSLGKYSY